MRRGIVLFACLLGLASCDGGGPPDATGASSAVNGPTAASPPPSSSPETPPPELRGPVTIQAKPVATGLVAPAAFTFAPDGRIFYGERIEGWIRIIDPTTGTSSRLVRVPKLDGEPMNSRGLLGIALHPNYPDPAYVYVFATREVDGELRSQIIRFTDKDGTGTGLTVIFDPGMPVTDRHNGGRILFGPDGMLYLVVGEHDITSDAQDLDSPNGKIHRVSPEGEPAQGNPFRNSTVFAYGIRNSFGMDFDPVSGDLWETDNGPECDDELNRVVPGANYGWGPSGTCDSSASLPEATNQDGSDPIMPVWFTEPSIGISGLAFCDGCGLGRRNDRAAFFGDFNLNQIHRVTLTRDRTGLADERVVFTHSNHILSIEAAPDGALYFSDPQGIYRLIAVPAT